MWADRELIDPFGGPSRLGLIDRLSNHEGAPRSGLPTAPFPFACTAGKTTQ